LFGIWNAFLRLTLCVRFLSHVLKSVKSIGNRSLQLYSLTSTAGNRKTEWAKTRNNLKRLSRRCLCSVGISRCRWSLSSSLKTHRGVWKKSGGVIGFAFSGVPIELYYIYCREYTPAKHNRIVHIKYTHAHTHTLTLTQTLYMGDSPNMFTLNFFHLIISLLKFWILKYL